MKSDQPSTMNSVRWVSAAGEVISCTEKIKVLNENLVELQQIAQDAFEDGVLMGVDERQLRQVFEAVVQGLSNSYDQ